MPSKRRGGRGVTHPVTVQLAIKYAMPKGKKRKMTKKVIDAAIWHRIENGEEPEGFEMEVINWQHGSRVTEAGNTDQDWHIVGRLLQAGASVRVTLRNHERME